MRSPSQMDIIQIDANVACHKRCSNCTRLVSHATDKWEMSPEQVKTAIESMRGWDRPGKVLGLIGGEVTLHSQFEQIARVFRDHWNPDRQVRLKTPIKDLNQFAEERLYDRTSGRGLWTSLGAGFYKHMETIFETFDHWNTNTHESGGLHQAMLIHRDDYCAQTGMSSEQWERNRDKCWVQNMWSASINDKGAYPCEIMASIDRRFYDGAHAWPVEQGWWQRTPADFGAMLELCNHCSLAQPGPSTVDAKNRDTISEKNRISLELVKSPAVLGKRFDPYTGQTEQRRVETKDSYVAGDRVSADHTSLRPKHVTCVVTCVGRAEQLAKTLKHNLALVDTLVVVTHPDDADTNKLVEGQDIFCIRSESCFADNHAFNKGRLINDAFHHFEAFPDWVILTDADVFLNPKLKDMQTTVLNPGCLYGTQRNGNQYTDREPNGFFQMFHVRAKSFPGRMCENFCSAGGIDSWFLQQFPRDKQVMIPELEVKHIEHESDWNGPRKGWRQCGIIWLNGIQYTMDKNLIPPDATFKLTDTRYGNTVEAKKGPQGFGPEVIGLNRQNHIVFQGVDIGDAHVHLAYYQE